MVFRRGDWMWLVGWIALCGMPAILRAGEAMPAPDALSASPDTFFESIRKGRKAEPRSASQALYKAALDELVRRLRSAVAVDDRTIRAMASWASDMDSPDLVADRMAEMDHVHRIEFSERIMPFLKNCRKLAAIVLEDHAHALSTVDRLEEMFVVQTKARDLMREEFVEVSELYLDAQLRAGVGALQTYRKDLADEYFVGMMSFPWYSISLREGNERFFNLLAKAAGWAVHCRRDNPEKLKELHFSPAIEEAIRGSRERARHFYGLRTGRPEDHPDPLPPPSNDNSPPIGRRPDSQGEVPVPEAAGDGKP